ncbi:hypothetical protein KEM48_002693 [Puccinia striiformis f. sp. tritici PST-130]|nr:hypothetical protein KEM48_002693 [Puccinia striiformis f. sp. tritici PST-130]
MTFKVELCLRGQVGLVRPARCVCLFRDSGLWTLFASPPSPTPYLSFPYSREVMQESERFAKPHLHTKDEHVEFFNQMLEAAGGK